MGFRMPVGRPGRVGAPARGGSPGVGPAPDPSRRMGLPKSSSGVLPLEGPAGPRPGAPGGRVPWRMGAGAPGRVGRGEGGAGRDPLPWGGCPPGWGRPTSWGLPEPLEGLPGLTGRGLVEGRGGRPPPAVWRCGGRDWGERFTGAAPGLEGGAAGGRAGAGAGAGAGVWGLLPRVGAEPPSGAGRTTGGALGGRWGGAAGRGGGVASWGAWGLELSEGGVAAAAWRAGGGVAAAGRGWGLGLGTTAGLSSRVGPGGLGWEARGGGATTGCDGVTGGAGGVGALPAAGTAGCFAGWGLASAGG